MDKVAAMGRLENSLDTDDKLFIRTTLRDAIAAEAAAVRAASYGKLKLDWTVNVALVFSVVVSLLGGTWWMSQLSSRVTDTEKTQTTQATDIKALTTARIDADTRTTKIEGKIDTILLTVQRIDSQDGKK